MEKIKIIFSNISSDFRKVVLADSIEDANIIVNDPINIPNEFKGIEYDSLIIIINPNTKQEIWIRG